MSNQLSQLPVEVLMVSDAPVPAQLSQLPLEVLRSSTPEPTVTERVELYIWLPE